MSRRRFTRAFATLLKQWIAHQETSRDPDDLAELAGSRKELDSARSMTREARRAWKLDPNESGNSVSKEHVNKVSASDDDIAQHHVQTYTGEG